MMKYLSIMAIASTLFMTACSNQNVSTGNNIPEAGGSTGTSTTNSQQGGAGSTSGLNNGSGGGVSNTGAGYYDPNAAGANADAAITLENLKNPKSPLSERIIYFEYNKASIKPEYQQVLNAHAKLLKQYPNIQIRLEGHADERGTREYNVALSEQRAKTVEWHLKGQGIAGSQMEIIGYGEEKPIRVSSNEQSWAENRRVEIRYPR